MKSVESCFTIKCVIKKGTDLEILPVIDFFIDYELTITIYDLRKV